MQRYMFTLLFANFVFFCDVTFLIYISDNVSLFPAMRPAFLIAVDRKSMITFVMYSFACYVYPQIPPTTTGTFELAALPLMFLYRVCIAMFSIL